MPVGACTSGNEFLNAEAASCQQAFCVIGHAWDVPLKCGNVNTPKAKSRRRQSHVATMAKKKLAYAESQMTAYMSVRVCEYLL